MFLLTYAKLQFLSQKNKIIFSGRLLFELLQKSLVCPKQCINFFRLNLDYADIIYVKSFKKSIKKNLTHYSIMQDWSSLAWTFRERPYYELGLVSLSDRRWSSNSFFFHKIEKGFSPLCLQEILNLLNLKYYPRPDMNQLEALNDWSKVGLQQLTKYLRLTLVFM